MSRSSRGLALLNVIIMLTVILLVVNSMLQITFGRQIAIRQHQDAYSVRKVTESAMVVLQACLRDQSFSTLNTSACSMSGPVTLGTWSSCGSSCRQINGTVTIGTHVYNIQAQWTDPGAAAGSDPGKLDVVCTSCLGN